jgi:hypothetical protein
MLQGHQKAARHLAAHRIVACDKQIRDHGDCLVMGESLAIGLRREQRGDEIWSGI